VTAATINTISVCAAGQPTSGALHGYSKQLSRVLAALQSGPREVV
jgi:hypothetical protein